MFIRLPLVALVIPIAITACGGDDGTPSMMPIEGACDGLLVTQDIGSRSHLDVGTNITWSNNPPLGGDHFGFWAAWDRSYAELQRGFWVHNLEHGGVVLLYHCDVECPEVVDSLLQVARDMKPDSSCGAPVTKRVIVTGDPLLPAGVQVAAAAWGAAYTGSCFDEYVAKFAAQRYGKGPEDTCADGASMGGALINP